LVEPDLVVKLACRYVEFPESLYARSCSSRSEAAAIPLSEYRGRIRLQGGELGISGGGSGELSI